MSKLDHLRLLKFLSKPRFAHEVAEHYGISKKLANFHLREAIKSGQVLISEKPVLQTLRSSNGKLKRFGGFVYVFRKSSMLADGGAKFTVRGVKNLTFKSKTRGSLRKGVFNRKFSGFTFGETSGPGVIVCHFKTSGPLTPEFDVCSAKVKLAKGRTIDQLGHRAQSSQGEVKPLSYVERTRLFQTLSKEPLAFLDLHGRFGVSKQTIKGLVKSGLLMEMWGPKAVGVRFKLTNKGRTYLKELEEAAKYEPKIRETSLIRLKQKIPL